MNSAFSFLPAWPLVPDAIFWAGLALVAAGLCGELLWRAWRLPRITGYAVIGLIAGNAGFSVIDVSDAGASRGRCSMSRSACCCSNSAAGSTCAGFAAILT